MESNRPSEPPGLSPDVIDFVRFCYRRRPVGWPELYDEMCAVAGRGLYRGWRFAELGDHGIGFSLHETPELARIASQVALEDGNRRVLVPGRSSSGRGFVAVGHDAEASQVVAAPVSLAVLLGPEGDELVEGVALDTESESDALVATVALDTELAESPPAALPPAVVGPPSPKQDRIPTLIVSPVGAG